ncbi:MAG: hypothetical protein Q7R50_00555 [Dehalococcoidales bacterium]|nr:hypothetical protein [Dehalococcoidales bacterium]
MQPRTNLSTSIAVIAFLGAAVGGLLGWGTGRVAWPSIEKFDQITYPAGLISGFLSCFLLSIGYSFTMIHRHWKDSPKVSILFGSVAGVLSGMATGAAYAYGEWFVGLKVDRDMSGAAWFNEVVFIAVLGALIGGVTGTIISFIIRPLLALRVINKGKHDSPAFPLFSSKVPLVLGILTVFAFTLELVAVITWYRTYSPFAFWMWHLNLPVFVFGTISMILSTLSLRESNWKEKRAFLGFVLGGIGLIGMLELQTFFQNTILD